MSITSDSANSPIASQPAQKDRQAIQSLRSINQLLIATAGWRRPCAADAIRRAPPVGRLSQTILIA